MAFDVYVGGFARFYAREWENVVQRWARETGTHYQMIGPGGAPPSVNWDEVAEAVTHWRGAINQGLGANIPSPLNWDESRESPYFTDRPGYEGYGALLVWASHAELGSTPPKTYSGEWYTDEAFLQCCKPQQGQKFRAITCGSLWLPGTFQFSFDLEDLCGEKAHICSNASLADSLGELNSQTFKMSAEQVSKARTMDIGDSPTLEELARFGYSVFHDLATKSVSHSLPILLST